MIYFDNIDYFVSTANAPEIRFQVGYEAARSGSDVNYSLAVKFLSLNSSTSGYGIAIYADAWLDGTKVIDKVTVKPASKMKWYGEEIVYNFAQKTVANKLNGVTSLRFRLYCETKLTSESAIRDKTYSFSLPVPAPYSSIDVLNNDPLRARIKVNNLDGYSSAIKWDGKYLSPSGTWSTNRYLYEDGRTISVTPMGEWIASNSLNKDITFTVETRTTGDVKIGEITQTIRFTALKDDVLPDISITIQDINPVTLALTNNPSFILLGKSNVEVTVVATPKYGATIRFKKVNGFDAPHVFEKATYLDYMVEVGDTRFASIPKSFKFSGIEYIPPSIQGTASWYTSTSNQVEVHLEGTYQNVRYGQTQNTLSLEYRYREGKSNTWTNWTSINPTISGNNWSYDTNSISGDDTTFDYEKDWEFEFILEDKLQSKLLNIYLPRSTPIADWGEYDWHFHVPVDIRTDLDYLSESDPPFAFNGINPFVYFKEIINGLTARIVALETKVDPEPTPVEIKTMTSNYIEVAKNGTHPISVPGKPIEVTLTNWDNVGPQTWTPAESGDSKDVGAGDGLAMKVYFYSDKIEINRPGTGMVGHVNCTIKYEA